MDPVLPFFESVPGYAVGIEKSSKNFGHKACGGGGKTALRATSELL